MSDAADRIAVSRARLRLAMTPVAKVLQVGSARTPSWLHRVGDVPLVSSVLESLGSWWSHHPMRPVAQVAGEASSAVVRPIAQRKPLALVAGAAVIGAAFAWSRPWRWIFRSALLAGLAPKLALRVASRLPIESWMTMLGSAISANRPLNRANRGTAPNTPAR